MKSSGPVIVFDAVCVLCCAHAQFVLRHDRRGRFNLAAMQGEAGQALYRRFNLDPSNPDTLIVVEGERLLRDSDAVLAIWEGFGGPWRLVGCLRFVPRTLRDGIYRRIARNRYQLFGKRDSCWVPDAAMAERFL